MTENERNYAIMKTWLITGCSSGIGAGIAQVVLEQGDNAIITARNTKSLAALAAKYPATALAQKLDICCKEDIANTVKNGLAKFGTIDFLINNAGYGYRSSVEEGDPKDVEQLFNTNFFGPIELIKEVLPVMRAQKSGSIINVSSIAAARSAVGSGYYAASKAALELMTNGLVKELAPLGIKAMIVEPGAFRTRFYDTSLKGTSIKIDDYNETAGKSRKENIVNLENQPGDPLKAGKVIVAVAQKDEYPFRLLLGSDAVRIVSEEMEARLKEIEDWKDISITTDYNK